MPGWAERKRKNLRVRAARLLGRVGPGLFARRLAQPVFVLGCARSGTTILTALLGDHPLVAEWSEANQVWDPGWYPWRPELQGKLPMEIDPAGFTRRWALESEPRWREIYGTFGAYQWLAGRPIFLNKSPFHTFRIPQLLERFPEARFVHVVRDGRAVAYSYADHLLRKGKLREWPAEEREILSSDPSLVAVRTAGVWRRSLLEVELQTHRRDLATKGRMHEVRYEDLVHDPDRALGALHRFLGIPELPFERSRWRLQSMNHKWRERLSAQIIQQLTELLEPWLLAKGYAP
jgi:hypothetical protein